MPPRRLVPALREELGLLRLRLDGDWTLAEFATLSTELVEAYQAGCAVHLATRTRFEPPPGTTIQPWARQLAFPLTVHAIRLESPGWIAVVGWLNPLRVISDVIGVWRRENTTRIQELHQYQLELLDRMTPTARAAIAPILLEQTFARTTNIARDHRVLDAETTPHRLKSPVPTKPARATSASRRGRRIAKVDDF